MTVQPIRLFGDPVLRTPAEPVVDFDKELRRLVEDLTETMRDAGRCRPGRAADRRRAAGVHVRRRRRARAPGQPGAGFPDEEEQDGPEGCLSIPGLYFDTKRRHERGRQGLQRVRRPGAARRQRPDGALRPARDRPPRRRPLHRPARPADPQGRDARHPRARSGTTRRPAGGQGQPARDARSLRPDACGLFSPARPRSRCPPWTPSPRPATSSSRWSPGPTRPPDGAASWPARRSVSWADERGIEVLTPERPRDEFLDRLRAARPRLRARSSRTARWCRRSRCTSPATGG